ncbi:hypothetical protein THAOC_09908 [Thalassiosira oceanica]|uniref:Uncharacterized protein n=1 Tax=Thalassiosira oceanica TaxID=159749 RepID=K0T6D2_THAOC|nr:hypothetical protein THAOC_09908 [Thalassiosira oceanica]|eukprot:EJK68881.1 hypothetical protein THAOC_09908 [Thalassiosira oceanica]
MTSGISGDVTSSRQGSLPGFSTQCAVRERCAGCERACGNTIMKGEPAGGNEQNGVEDDDDAVPSTARTCTNLLGAERYALSLLRRCDASSNGRCSLHCGFRLGLTRQSTARLGHRPKSCSLTPEPGKERGLSSDKQQKSRPSAKEDMPVGQLEAKIQGAARKGRE